MSEESGPKRIMGMEAKFLGMEAKQVLMEVKSGKKGHRNLLRKKKKTWKQMLSRRKLTVAS